MPIYEYRCAGCGAEFEKYVPGQTVTVACPRCQSSEVKRTLSLVGIKTTGGAVASAGMAGGGGCCGGGCGCH